MASINSPFTFQFLLFIIGFQAFIFTRPNLAHYHTISHLMKDISVSTGPLAELRGPVLTTPNRVYFFVFHFLLFICCTSMFERDKLPRPSLQLLFLFVIRNCKIVNIFHYLFTKKFLVFCTPFT